MYFIACRFTELQEIKCAMAGKLLFLRFKATTGDAMGMNMVSKVRKNYLILGSNSASKERFTTQKLLREKIRIFRMEIEKIKFWHFDISLHCRTLVVKEK